MINLPGPFLVSHPAACQNSLETKPARPTASCPRMPLKTDRRTDGRWNACGSPRPCELSITPVSIAISLLIICVQLALQLEVFTPDAGEAIRQCCCASIQLSWVMHYDAPFWVPAASQGLHSGRSEERRLPLWLSVTGETIPQPDSDMHWLSRHFQTYHLRCMRNGKLWPQDWRKNTGYSSESTLVYS